MEILVAILIVAIVVVVGIFLVTGLTGAPFVPTLKVPLNDALSKLYKIGKNDGLIDLGAGNGVVLEMAAKKGASAVGVELNPFLVAYMKLKFCKNKKIKVKYRNFYHFRFPKETTVVYVFMIGLRMTSIYKKIEKEASRLGKPIFLISNAFDVKDIKPEKCVGQFYLYKVKPVVGKK